MSKVAQVAIPPTAAQVEDLLYAHAETGRGFDRVRSSEFVPCSCGTRHPLHDTSAFPTHRRHLAEKTVVLFPAGTVSVTQIENLLYAHAETGRGFDRVRSSEFATCSCGTRHPLHDMSAFPTHRRHLAQLIAALPLA